MSEPAPSGSASSATPRPELYRRIIDWDRRLAREGPYLLERLGLGAGSRLLDLGSATGEHDRWLAARGVAVVGVDRAPDMVAAAREAAAGDPRLSYVEAPIEALPGDVEGPFDAAICLGNTLVHLESDAALAACFAGVGGRLRAGGRFLVQVLNYEAIVSEGRRAFPVVIRPAGGGAELVFLRFMDHRERGFVDFESAVLERRPDVPARLLDARRSRLRTWTREDLVGSLARAVGPVRTFGGLADEPFDPVRSGDLVLLAERTP